MTIIVTPGEIALIEAFNKADIEIVKKDLKVGDIHIEHEDNVVYIFERKAKGDLDASIKDGRYHEQKSRLIETGLPLKNIVYIIEQLSKPRNQGVHKRVWSAICNTQHRDGFTVFQTRTIEETVEYIANMAKSVINHSVKNDEIINKTVNVDIKKRTVSSIYLATGHYNIL